MSTEFRVIPSENMFKHVFYILLLLDTPQKLLRASPDRRLAHLSRRRGAGGHDLFSDGSLEEWAAWAGVSEMQATTNYSCWLIELTVFHIIHHSNYA
jgi:hypothetical protein